MKLAHGHYLLHYTSYPLIPRSLALKNLITSACLASVAALLPIHASAQTIPGSAPAVYVGADPIYWRHKGENIREANSVGARVRLGVEITPYVAFEVHGGSLGEDTHGRYQQELNYVYGALARGTLPLSYDFRLYALAGYSEVKIDVTDMDANEQVDINMDGFSFGGGVEIDLFDNTNFFVEGLRYVDRETRFETVGAGVRYVF